MKIAALRASHDCQRVDGLYLTRQLSGMDALWCSGENIEKRTEDDTLQVHVRCHQTNAVNFHCRHESALLHYRGTQIKQNVVTDCGGNGRRLRKWSRCRCKDCIHLR